MTWTPNERKRETVGAFADGVLFPGPTALTVWLPRWGDVERPFRTPASLRQHPYNLVRPCLA